MVKTWTNLSTTVTSRKMDTGYRIPDASALLAACRIVRPTSASHTCVIFKCYFWGKGKDGEWEMGRL